MWAGFGRILMLCYVNGGGRLYTVQDASDNAENAFIQYSTVYSTLACSVSSVASCRLVRPKKTVSDVTRTRAGRAQCISSASRSGTLTSTIVHRAFVRAFLYRGQLEVPHAPPLSTSTHLLRSRPRLVVLLCASTQPSSPSPPPPTSTHASSPSSARLGAGPRSARRAPRPHDGPHLPDPHARARRSSNGRRPLCPPNGRLSARTQNMTQKS